MQSQAGQRHETDIPFSLTESPEMFGDEIEGVFKWNDGGNLGRFAGTAVRLHFVLKDADLYAFRFRNR